jgi:hypothetical protein
MNAKKNWLAAALGMALVASTIFTAATPAEAAYTRDLTIGSTGADVVELQTFLVARGHLVMPVGVPMGYFGTLTRAALARYQAVVGIVPAAGYFGPITSSHMNAMVTPPPSQDDDDDDDNDSDDDDDLSGGEGDIRDFNVLGNPGNEEIEEGDTEEVFGFEFEAEDSDLRVERLEMLASSTEGTDEPWEVIESARLLRDGEEVASVDDLDDEDSWDEEDDDQYSFRFENIDEIVDEGEEAQFIVEFTAVDNIDSDDDPTEIDLSITNDGLRAVDAEGIDIYEGDEDETRTVTFGEAEGGDLELSLDEDDNDDRVVFVDEDNDTDGIEIMRFTIEANASENMIDELSVELTRTSGSETLSEVISNLTLEVDGEEIGSESVPSGASPVTVTFEDLEDEFVVGEDEEVEVVIYADIVEQDGSFAEGFTFEASVAGSGIEAEDSNGDDVTVSDNVTGGEVELRVNGLNVELVDTSVDNVFTADESNEASIKTFNFQFEVTAEGDDIFIDKSTQREEFPSASGAGTAWATTSDTNATTTNVSAILSASGSTSGDTAGAFKVADGNTRTFNLAVTVTAGQQGSIGTMVTGINWDTDSTVGTSYYTQDLEDFKIDPVFFTKFQ